MSCYGRYHPRRAAWTYDLFRPDEPYSARGVHPSGVGIRRYRLTTDLTAEELDFLELMGNLSLINFINPGLLFINSFDFNPGTSFTFSGFHYPTSFGYDVGANILLSVGELQFFAAAHHYRNYVAGCYGIQVELVDYPVTIAGQPALISPMVHVWTQPKDQEFKLLANKNDVPYQSLVKVYLSEEVGSELQKHGPQEVTAAQAPGSPARAMGGGRPVGAASGGPEARGRRTV